jgi:hypothetical protein
MGEGEHQVLGRSEWIVGCGGGGIKCAFILVQLNVQFLMFLKSLLAEHVSDVTAYIVRSTTVVYSHRFYGFWCVYSMGLVMVLEHIVTISRSGSDWETIRME